MNNKVKKSYQQIVESSALIGVSSIISIAFRVVRMKVFAVLVGPAGIGFLAVYDSISELARNLAGLGLNSSGVRQIAEAVGSGDVRRIARTVTTLRRVALCSGITGALLLLLFSRDVSRVTFGDERKVGAVALLALAVCFNSISATQTALVQGMRRVSDLARINVLGAFFALIISVVIVYFLRERGLVLSLVCVAAVSILTSWWYARKIRVEKVKMTLIEIVGESSGLLRLGIVFMASGFMGMGSAYLIRIIVLRKLGVDAVGFYQAAWAFGGLYVGFILQTMGADFYPRLTAVASDNPECNRLVNEQAEVGLLLAGPGVIGTLVFAPLIVGLFYSSRFEPAVEILRWFCLGMIVRVVLWPVGFILLAKGEAMLFFWSELFSNVAQIGLVALGLFALGLEGIGVGFFGMYLCYFIAICLIARRLSGFRWSAANRRIGIISFLLVTAVFIGWYVLPRIEFYILGAILTSFSTLYSFRILRTFVPLVRLPSWVRGAFGSLQLTKCGPSKSDDAIGERL